MASCVQLNPMITGKVHRATLNVAIPITDSTIKPIFVASGKYIQLIFLDMAGSKFDSKEGTGKKDRQISVVSQIRVCTCC